MLGTTGILIFAGMCLAGMTMVVIITHTMGK